MQGESSYTAWDGQRYAGEAPAGWYMAADNRWWPNEEARQLGTEESVEADQVVTTLPPPPVPNQPSSRMPRSGERRTSVDQLDRKAANVFALWPTGGNRSTSVRLLFGSVIGFFALFFTVFVLSAVLFRVPTGSVSVRPDDELPPLATLPTPPTTFDVLDGPVRPVSEPGGGSAKLVNCGWTEPRTASLIVTNNGTQATSFVITIAFEEVETLTAGTAAIIRREVTVATSAIEPSTAQEFRPPIDGEPRLNVCRVTSIRPVG